MLTVTNTTFNSRSLRTVYKTCSNSARSSRSGAIDERILHRWIRSHYKAGRIA